MSIEGSFHSETWRSGALTGADRQKMSVALNNLKDKGKIGVTDRYVWLLEERQ